MIEKGSGEKGEGRGDLFWGRWALNVKDEWMHGQMNGWMERA